MYQNVFNAKMYHDSSLTGNVISLMKQTLSHFKNVQNLTLSGHLFV